MRKYIFLLLLSFSTTSFAYDFESDGLYYNIVDHEMWDVDYPCVEVTYDDESDNQGSTQSVTSVVVPATVEYAETLYHVIGIGQRTFIAGHYPRLSSLVLPEGLLYIDDDAIAGRKPLKSVAIPSTVTTIGKGAFDCCNNLKSIVIPNSVWYIGESAFSRCWSLESAILPSGITDIPDELFSECEKLKTIDIPIGITRIGVSAFCGCASLESVHLPNSLLKICDEAFAKCARLEYVFLPANLKEIGINAFAQSNRLNVNFPSGIQSIEALAFYRTSVKSFKSPLAMSVINRMCFHVSSLQSVTITPNIKRIEMSAFEYNENLTKVTIEGGVEYIGKDAFAGCKSLVDFYCLTDAVPQADDYAFADYIYDYENGGALQRNGFISETGIAEQATLHVRKSLLNRFQHTYPWSKFKSIVAIEDETAIGPIAIDDESSSTRRVYDLVGRLRRAAQPGMNVIVGSDGRSRKVMVK